MEILEKVGISYAVGAFAILYALYFALYPWFFSSLRGVPGPWYAAYSKWWLVYITVRGIRAKSIHALHDRYGPWVRISPTEISTCDSEAIVPIYGVKSKFTKTEFYTYQLRGIPELFTMSDRQQHAKRRRELAHLFSMSTVTEYESVIAKQVKQCMDFIGAEGRADKVSNLYDWWHYLSMDIICELSFGMTFKMLENGASSPYIKDMYGSLAIEPIRWHFGLLNKYASWAPLKFVRDSEACSIRAMSRGVQMVREYKQRADKMQRKSLLQKLIDARDEAGNPLPDDALNVEATGFILAGSHTTSSSLTWIVWRILKSPSIKAKLVKELDEALAGLAYDAIPSHANLENLTYLNCVIKEGLRIDTAVPGSTPRYVPPEGAHINGHVLPGGSIISIQAYSCHRDPNVFPQPEEFIPDRWLEETADMRKLYVPFGPDGPRKCIGIHLAYMELRVILTSLFRRFDLSFAGITTDASMDMAEFWLANPCGQRLAVIAKERSDVKSSTIGA